MFSFCYGRGWGGGDIHSNACIFHAEDDAKINCMIKTVCTSAASPRGEISKLTFTMVKFAKKLNKHNFSRGYYYIVLLYAHKFSRKPYVI